MSGKSLYRTHRNKRKGEREREKKVKVGDSEETPPRKREEKIHRKICEPCDRWKSEEGEEGDEKEINNRRLQRSRQFSEILIPSRGPCHDAECAFQRTRNKRFAER